MVTAPLGSPGPRRLQKQHAGSLKVDAQPSAVRIRLPEGAARKVSPRCGELTFRTPARHRAPNLQGP